MSIAVFEASVDKAIILDDQEKYLIEKEKQVVSVDGVNGPDIKSRFYGRSIHKRKLAKKLHK